MKHRTFFWFILPTLSAMILFIALPIVSVFVQSLHVGHEQILEVSESCGPFGCTQTISTAPISPLQRSVLLGRKAIPIPSFGAKSAIFPSTAPWLSH